MRICFFFFMNREEGLGKQLHARPVGTDGYSKVFFSSSVVFIWPIKMS